MFDCFANIHGHVFKLYLPFVCFWKVWSYERLSHIRQRLAQRVLFILTYWGIWYWGIRRTFGTISLILRQSHSNHVHQTTFLHLHLNFPYLSQSYFIGPLNLVLLWLLYRNRLNESIKTILNSRLCRRCYWSLMIAFEVRSVCSQLAQVKSRRNL